jgi:methylglyoxal/glyoxal reductase
LTTKVWNTDQGYDTTIKAFNDSLKHLKLDYIDLYLIHWPVDAMQLETWKAMEFLLTSKSLKTIGVSNYMVSNLQEMRNYAVILPAINQVEFSPFLYQKKLLQYCRSEDIQLQAYSPLARGLRLDHPTILNIARKYEKTPAQIMIRYAIQHQVIPLPKSVIKNRIQQNIDVFDFEMSLAEMDSLNKLHDSSKAS